MARQHLHLVSDANDAAAARNQIQAEVDIAAAVLRAAEALQGF